MVTRMLFNSWTFVIFLLATFALYHFLPWPDRWRMFCQIGLLTVASYIFYAWHTPWLVIILAASTWINAYAALKLIQSETPARGRQRWVIIAISSNLGLLAFFKYASLMVKTVLPGAWWTHAGWDLSQIPLPVGISFFTFQGISLVVDVYRSGGKGIPGLEPPRTARESLWLVQRMAFFKAFFPQLVAGPIVKAHEFMYQISAKNLRDVAWDDASRKLILGFFLKMVVADNLKEATASLAFPYFSGMPGINLLFLLYGFSFQIFADFAGYSLIAMGLARLFGYQLPINFNFPYLSQSITEFWRRWHISLSTWLREYLYFPLGGNRRGAVRTYFNLIIVMLLGGLWHGAAWSYMVWGGAHGLLLALERFAGVRNRTEQESAELSKSSGMAAGCWKVFRIIFTFNVVSCLWLLFKLPHFPEVIEFARQLTTWKRGLIPQPIYTILFFGLPVLAYHFWPAIRRLLQRKCREPVCRVVTDVIYAFLFFMILVNSGSPGTFIYFQF